ncbi:ArnT family glycosyltransferase [Konateibacter massiliensis]|uniref:ArnT family glycosyltransferase n=1 Tax=Konateibacter massiliensis TaxID=2002841 RepID=UPI000C14634B|nr:glycosyltransferase family 39 protein [Konateibacter massiliensis]
MEKINKLIKEHQSVVVIALMIIGSLARLLYLGSYPGGVSQDEAFSAYDAYSLANYGIDCFGYHFPVYNTTWGSGMSALYSWLSIPWIKLFGLNMWTIRLSQAILGILSLFVLYLLMKKVTNDKIALITLLLFAISPWHIVMTRWGLDSATTPAFLLFGLYFFVLGLEKERYLLWSAVFYGLSLYCYAFLWTLLPFILLFQVGYAIYYKKIHLSFVSVASAFLVFLFALPLLLFLLVNYGFISEIKTGFLSIPKVAYFRSGELASGGFMGKLYTYYKVMFLQDDGNIWNTVPGFGLHYKFGLVFVFVGMFYSIWCFVTSFKNKIYNPFGFFVFQFIIGSFAALVVDKCDINKLNLLHIPAIAFAGIGIYKLCQYITPRLIYVIVLIYLVGFGFFEHAYYTSYQEEISKEFNGGITQAVQYAMELTENTICVTDKAFHSQVMFASQIPAPEYVDTVVYTNYPAIWLETSSFGQFEFQEKETLPALSDDKVYIWGIGEQDYFEKQGYTITEFENFIVACKEKE